MLRRILLAIVVVCFIASFGQAQDAVQLLAGEGPTLGWRSDNGSEFPGAVVALKMDDQELRGGKPTLRLDGDFTGGGNYVQASKNFDADVRTLSMWLKYGGSEHLTIRVIDATGQCHQLNVKIDPTAEWQRLVVPVADFFAKRSQPDAVQTITKYEAWGGAKDGKWHSPGKSMHILIGKTEELKKRTLWLSDIQVTAAAAPETASAGVAQAVSLEEVAEGEVGFNFSLGAEFPGAKGTLTVEKDQPEAGRSALKLDADFTAGGMYVEANKDLKPIGMTELSAIRIRMKSDNVTKFSVRLVDSTGQCFQKKGNTLAAGGQWQELAFKPAQFEGGEHWGGANDGKWHGPAALVSFLIGKDSAADHKPILYIADAFADAVLPAKGGAVSYTEDFEKGSLAEWKTSSKVEISGDEPFKGAKSLMVMKSADDIREIVFATGPSFPVVPGPVQVKLASKTDLTSMDSSYNLVVTLESLGAGGAPVGTATILEQFRKNAWRPVAKQVEIPAGATSARFHIQIHKETPGRIWIDELSVAPLVVAKKDDRIQRLMFDTAQLGNLLLPSDSREVTLTVWSTKPLPESQRTANVVVKDYWGAEQSSPLPVALTKKPEKANGNVVYEGKLDLSPVTLAIGRYYELHAEIARDGNEPFKNYTSLAILPEAPANSFKPEEIPFTSRTWDNRIADYVLLTHRLGIRICGVWSGWEPTPPYKNYASQLELIHKLGMGWLTGSPAHAIEQRSKGWEKYDEKALREGARQFVKDFGHVRPMIINLGNEPGNKGDAVKPEVNAYRILYDEFKKIDPTIIVVGTSAGPIEDFFKAGFGEWCDAYDFHVYEDAIGVRRTLEVNYPALFKKYGHAKPIWSTELGLNSQGLARQTVAAEVTKKFANFFAAGGVNVSWFGLLYPDPDAKLADSFGSAHNVFDCRYSKYAPKLDAVAYFNAVNTILDKKFVAEKVYNENTRAFLFRNAKGDSLQVLYKDKGREDVFVPLNGVNDVQVIRIDGSRNELDAGGRGVTLTINEDPMLMLYQGGDSALPAELGKPAITLGASPTSIVRTEPLAVEVGLHGVTADAVSLIAQPSWKVAKSEGGNGSVTFTLNAPAETTVREADMVIALAGPNGKPNGQIYYRPSVTGTTTLAIVPVPIVAGKEPAVKVVLRNNSPEPQDIAWDVSLTGEQGLVGGQFSAITAPTAYFTDSPSGVATVPGRQSVEVVLPLAGADRYKVYRARATAKDASGRVIVDERPVAGFVGVPKSAAAPTLDGVLDEDGWKRSAVQRVDKADTFWAYGKGDEKQSWTGPEDLSADIRFTWDDQNLYVGVAVTDDIFGPVKPEYATWQQDGIQFLIDPMRTSNQKVGKYDYGIADRADGTTLAECFLSAVGDIQMGKVPDIKIATKRGEKGDITYEIAIPWKNVAPFKPAVGADLGLTLIVNEDDGKGRDSYMMWFGNASTKDVDTVGDLILMD